MPIRSTTKPLLTLLGEGSGPDWKIHRYPYDAASGIALANMFAGATLKFNAARDKVMSAVAADDAVIAGICVDLPDVTDDPLNPTVAIALQGTFDENNIHYADDPTAPFVALSAAAKNRLASLNIFLDPAVPA